MDFVFTSYLEVGRPEATENSRQGKGARSAPEHSIVIYTIERGCDDFQACVSEGEKIVVIKIRSR